MAQFYVGLDVHSKSTVYAIETHDGELVDRGAVATSEEGLRWLRDRHRLPPETPVGLETGTVSFYVARQLSKLALKPVVIDAREVRTKAHRPTQKSDRRDALEICEGLRSGQYRAIVHVPPLAISALRDSVSRRRHFVRQQTAEMNAAKRLLRSAGLGLRARLSLRTERGWEQLLSTLRTEEELAAHVELHRQAWRCARVQVCTLDARLSSQAAPFAEDLRRLQTVPGVGPTVAITTVAVFSDVQRFPSSHHASSYVGLVPSTYQSGSRDAHGRITRRGSSELRAMLCEAAQQARRPSNPLHPYFSALCARRGYKMAIIAVAHRLCRILFAMLRTGTDFDVAKLNVEAGPFERKQIRLYRLKRPLASQRT